MSVSQQPPTLDPPTRRHGTAAAALRHRDFRVMWLGALASNIGTWMQTLVLPAYIADRTSSATWVGLFVFAQLGPLLVLAVPGGVLADRFPRRPWLVSMQVAQLVLTVIIAVLVAQHSAMVWLFVVQLLIGIANALNGPAMQGTMPNLVDPRDLPGAISLNSVMINGSRVIGPSIAAVLMSRGVTEAGILGVNAVTYVFFIVALLMIRVPEVGSASDERGWANLAVGVRIARRRSVVGRSLAGMALFSFVCLPYVGLFPMVAHELFDVSPTGPTYKWLYAVWGLGALAGALSIGTALAHVDKRRLVRPALLGFAVSLAAFSLIGDATVAFPISFLLGFFYFGFATSLLTVLQQNLRSSERARVMSLWMMAFGGTVAIGNLAFGPVVDAIGARPVLLLGAVSAVGLSWWLDVARRRVTTLADEDDDEPAGRSRSGASTTQVDERRHDRLQAGGTAGLDEHGISAGE